MRASTSPGEVPQAGTQTFRYYIDVMDVQALADQVRPRLLATGLTGRHGPMDQTYGQREFMVTAPDGDLVVFGQIIFEIPGTFAK